MADPADGGEGVGRGKQSAGMGGRGLVHHSQTGKQDTNANQGRPKKAGTRELLLTISTSCL